VVIVARGGGSLEDLWAFNVERVARAIAKCSVAVVSAIGHETDFTIADFVADLRAPTPSAAAEMVIATRASLVDRLDTAERTLRQAARLAVHVLGRRLHGLTVDPERLHRVLGRRSQAVDDLEYRLRDVTRGLIGKRKQYLEATAARLARRDVRLQFAEARRRLEAMDARGSQFVRLRLGSAREALAPLEAHLKQLSPLTILDRGYAIVERAGTIVKSPADAPVGSDVRIRLAQGGLDARVTEITAPVPQADDAH